MGVGGPGLPAELAALVISLASFAASQLVRVTLGAIPWALTTFAPLAPTVPATWAAWSVLVTDCPASTTTRGVRSRCPAKMVLPRGMEAAGQLGVQASQTPTVTPVPSRLKGPVGS